MKLWCDRHDAVHHLTAGQVERVVYALSCGVADALCEPDGDRIFAGEDATTYIPCPLDYFELSRSIEGFAEFVESYVEARRKDVSS